AGRRHDDKSLASLVESPEPVAAEVEVPSPLVRLPRDARKRQQLMEALSLEAREDFFTRHERLHERLYAFLHDEGVAAVLRTDPHGEGGIVFAQGAGSGEAGGPAMPPVVALA